MILLGTLILLVPYVVENRVAGIAVFSTIFLAILLLSPSTGLVVYYLLISFGTLLVTNVDKQIVETGLVSITYEGMLSFVLVLGSLFLILFDQRIKTKKVGLLKSPGLALFIIFVIVCLLEAILIHPDKVEALKEVMKMASVIMFYWISIMIFRREDIPLIRNALTLVFMVLLGYSISLYIAQSETTIFRAGVEIARFEPGVLSAVDLSVWMAVLFPIVVDQLFKKKYVVRSVMWGAIILLSLFFITIFGARASVFGLAISLLVYLIIRKKYAIALIYAVAVILVILVSPWKFMLYDLLMPTQSNNLSDRIENIWLPILRSGISNVIVGVGARGFGDYLYKVSGWYFTAAHNIYLEILVENGIIALIIFLSANAQILFQSIKTIKSKSLLLFNTVPLMIYLLAGFTSTLRFILFYMQIFMFLSVSSVMRGNYVSSKRQEM